MLFIVANLAAGAALGAGGIAFGNKLTIGNTDKPNRQLRKITRHLAKKAHKKHALIKQLQAKPTSPALAGLTLEKKYIRHYWRPYWKHGVLIVGCLLSYQGAQMIAAYLVKTVVNGAVGIGTLQLVPVLGAALLIGYPLGLWMNVKAEKLIAKVQSGMTSSMRADLFAHMQKLSLNFIKNVKPGDLSARFISDVDKFVDALSYNFIFAVFRLLTMGIICTQLWFIEWHLTLLVLGVLPGAIWLYNVLRSKAVEADYRFHTKEGTVNNLVQEAVRVQPMIKSFDAQTSLNQHFVGGLDALQADQYEALFKKSLLRVTGAQSLFLSDVAATIGGAFLVMGQAMTPGSLVAFLALWSIAKNNFSGAVQYNIPALLAASGAGQRIEDILSQTPSVVDQPTAYPLPPFNHAIRFENVSFSYDNRQASLVHSNCTIYAGEHVAIVGDNGAGKSTVLNLLMRFYDPDNGHIVFDRHDIRGVTQASLHEQMSIVFQEPMLFDATFAENIMISKPDASRDEMIAAAKQAQIHDFISSLPAGYETLIGEAGGALSGGQRQKVSIARALLRDPAILILDEVSNGLDRSSQASIMETVNHIVSSRRRTVINITHHTSQLANTDRVLLLSNGKLLEQEKQKGRISDDAPPWNRQLDGDEASD